MKAWLTRDKSGALKLHTQEPFLVQEKHLTGSATWRSYSYEQLTELKFPFVTFENSPIQFEIKEK